MAQELVMITLSHVSRRMYLRTAYSKFNTAQMTFARRKLANAANNDRRSQILYERNSRIAMYLASAVIGAIGATYASVPMYKLFCQKTGFGGATQRVVIDDGDNSTERSFYEMEEEEENPSLSSILKRRMLRQLDRMFDLITNAAVKTTTSNRIGNTHANTWTDEEAAAKLSTLKPVENGRLLKIHFTTNTSDVLPWTFVPTQRFVKVVPGETALCFFTATNNSNKPITGVATYNVQPPKAGLYFNKVQCFCFEEQRLLPGETVDMPVFFYIDPEFMDDPYMDRVHSITLSYTFFKTDIEDEEEEEKSSSDSSVENLSGR